MSLSYLLLVGISLVLGLGSQAFIRHTYAQWKKVPLGTSQDGQSVAQGFLTYEGLFTVGIKSTSGSALSDYYDPRSSMLVLSQDTARGTSVASAAIACHEAGHAVQHQKGYGPMKIRALLVPVVTVSEQAWMIALIAGIFFNLTGFITLGIGLFCFVVLFQIVTLPVEFDASRRAVAYLSTVPGLSSTEVEGARKVLFAAGLTYLAAALTSVLQLLYLLAQRDRD